MGLVLLHGFSCLPAMWEPVLDHPRLARVRAHCPALPGHGARPEVPRDHDFTRVIDTLAERLAARAPMILAGYSLGARVALALALRHPALVRAALLIGVHPGMDDPDERAARRAWDESQAAALEERGVRAFMAAWERLDLFATQTEAQVASQRPGRTAHQAHGLAWVMRTLGTGRMPSMWHGLAVCPVTLRVLVGGRDHKYVAIARRISERAPRVSHRVVPDVGHNVVLEAPRVVAEELAGLLG